MEKALKNVPRAIEIVPEGVMIERINPKTGAKETDGAMIEYFLQEQSSAESVE